MKKVDKYAIAYLSTDDVFITLGGVENSEMFEEACVRELMDEAGLIVKQIKEFLVVREYRVPNEVWEHHHFICEIISENVN